MFFGIFAASMMSPVHSHVAQCAGARAIGARTSLASAKRESGPVRVQTLIPLLITALSIRLIPRLRVARLAMPVIRALVRQQLARPSLLLRPPPAVSFA